MRILACLIVSLGLALLSAAPASAANGPMPATIGSKGPVSIPVDGDGFTMFRMPSSIAWSLDHRIDLDFFVFYGVTTMRNAQNDFESSGTTLGPALGFVFSPGRPDFDQDESAFENYSPAHKLTLGAGLYVDIAGGGEKSFVRYTTFPDTIGLTTGIQFLNFSLTGAFAITEWLSIGASLHIIRATVGTRTLVGGSGDDSTPLNGSPQINGVALPGNPTYADFLGLFGDENTPATDPATYFKADVEGIQFSGTLSLSFRPRENLGFGFSYRFESINTELEGDGELHASKTFNDAIGGLSPAIQGIFLGTLPNGGANGFIGEYDVKLDGISVPRQIRFNVVFWPIDRLMLAAEVAWIEWHRAFDVTQIELSKGRNQDLNFIVGSDTINTTSPQRWKNQWVFSLYGAFAATDWLSLRLGFNYGETPFNIDRLDNAPSSGLTEAHLNFGFGLNYKRFQFNFLTEYAFETTKKQRQSSVPSGNNTTFSSEQWFFHFGFSYSF